MRWVGILVLASLGFACSSPPPPEDSGADAPIAPGDSGPEECTVAADCDDGMFCNGEEACDPGATGADAQGCVAGAAPCTAGCDEAADACDACAEPDADGDGSRSTACGGSDCDDSDPDRYPGNAEVCDVTDHDEDCDPSTYGRRDSDGDDHGDAQCCNEGAGGAPVCGTDCDDARAMVHPGSTEACDSTDNDCDGATDEGVMTTFYRDADGDGFGSAATTATGCTAPMGYVGTAGDCNDGTVEINPSRGEVCGNMVDDNCNGMTDESGTATFYRDADGDGRGDSAMPMTVTSSCSPPAGYVPITQDCDDSDETIYEGAPELCDRIDNDCSQTGAAEGGPDASEDVDSDGFAPIGAACAGGPLPATDCRDDVAAFHPGATDLCDRVDGNCSLPGAMAGGVDAAEDADADMHAATGAACTAGPAPAFPRDDCDDAVATTHSGAPEVCNRVDDDCSSGGGLAAAEDADSDGHTSAAYGLCSGGLPQDDCDDTSADIRPGAAEQCNAVDDDCDGVQDGPPATMTCSMAGEGCIAGHCATITDLSVGGGHACVVSSRGRVACWGSNSDGQLGVPSTGATDLRASPVRVPGLTDAIAVSAGGNYTCALRTGGAISCWGGNQFGQLGDGTTTPRATPAAVLTITDATGIGAGAGSACARRPGGVWCWGRSLTNGSSMHTSTPGAITGLPAGMAAIDVSVGGGHACAIVADGRAYCWGVNSNYQLGDGTTTTSTSAVLVAGGGTWTDIAAAAGGSYTCAIATGGAVRCWGEGTNGSLGDGNLAAHSSAVPVTVSGISASQIVAATQTCARVGLGVSCWGYNTEGQVGDGTTMPRATPVPITVPNLFSVSVASFTSCVRHGRGVSCWGRDSEGQLGDGAASATPRTTPGAVLF